MLVHRLRRWPNIDRTLGECLVFAGYNRVGVDYNHNRRLLVLLDYIVIRAEVGKGRVKALKYFYTNY